MLHMSECQEKAVQCSVSACATIFKRKDAQEHIRTAASSHAVLQAGEVQKLRGLMHFKRAEPTLILQEEGVFSFCWKANDLRNLSESVASTEYRCPNGNRWRGLLTLKGGSRFQLSLQLVASVTPVIVGTRIVLMPETVAEKIYSFEAREFKEGQLIGKISSEEISCIIPDGIMTMKFVMSYYILREI